MATGNEPRLSGQGKDTDDNSPMIGSTRTRVILSTRGAYTAGNLQLLIDNMNPQQAMQFKRIYVQQALDAVDRLLPPDVLNNISSFLRTKVFSECIKSIRQWLSKPSDRSLKTVQKADTRLEATIDALTKRGQAAHGWWHIEGFNEIWELTHIPFKLTSVVISLLPVWLD
jgi:hypothetical protein